MVPRNNMEVSQKNKNIKKVNMVDALYIQE
jgi:hypothetical protein